MVMFVHAGRITDVMKGEVDKHQEGPHMQTKTAIYKTAAKLLHNPL